MIIAFEGAPAVGKTTLAKALATQYGFTRIAEVNELFSPRPQVESEFWYHERQFDRMALAIENDKSLLDGDPFQAIWFSWLYPDRGYPSWSKALGFFDRNEHSIIMPSRYVYLHVDEEERFLREQLREAARKHSNEQFAEKWQRYQDFTAPQMALFQAINKEFTGWVTFIEPVDIDQIVRTIAAVGPGFSPTWSDYAHFLRKWFHRNAADDFR